MKFRLFIGLLAALGAVCQTHTAHATIQWEGDYNTALNKARIYNKPLFIDFYTEWCGWCKKLDADVYPDPKVQAVASNFVMLRMDAEGAGAPYAQSFRVTGFPTLIFLSPQGRPIGVIPGYVEANELTQLMRQVLGQGAAPTAATSPVQARTAQKTAAQTAAKPITPSMQRMASGPSNWRSQPELRRAAGSDNYEGAFLLDENGAVALDAPVKAPKLSAKTTKPMAKSHLKKAAR